MTTQTEKEIIKEEKELVAEIKKEEKLMQKLLKNTRVLIALVAVLILGGLTTAWYFINASNQVYIEKSQVTAASIDLASTAAGKLEAVYVNDGDMITANTVVARVGNELVKSKIDGLVIMAREDIGKLVSPGEKVVSMVSPSDLRIVGQLAEDKGLSKVSVGQRAVFTVDAFGGRKYEGIVDEISSTSRSGDVVFSISDKRQENEFNVKVRYDVSRYPELKNGMSAKIWIYRQ